MNSWLPVNPILTPSSSAIAEYGEQVSSFLRRANSKAEGVIALNQYSSSLLENLPSLLPAIRECSSYAGMAFYGRFQAVNLRLIKKLAAENVPSIHALESIRAGKALRVAASAKEGWDFLLKEDPTALWAAIYLNLCTSPVSVRVSKASARDEDVDDEDADDDGDDTEDDEPNDTRDDDAN
jgi:hypothetical protein